jgi:amidase
VVGLKPTVGLVPTEGVVPISWSQDAPGPMARTVADAAALLDVMADTDAADDLEAGVRGKRIGVPRDLWGYSPGADAAAERALSWLSQAGAQIVDDLALPALKDMDDSAELTLLLVELKAGLAKYLPTREAPVRTLEDVVAFNREHAEQELVWFGQELFEKALELDGVASAEYLEAVDVCTAAGLAELDRTLGEHDLEALFAPAMAPASPIDLVNGDHGAGSACDSSALAGAPILTLPVELVHGLPVAVSVWGRRGSEKPLLQIGRAVEAARDAASGPLPEPAYVEAV